MIIFKSIIAIILSFLVCNAIAGGLDMPAQTNDRLGHFIVGERFGIGLQNIKKYSLRVQSPNNNGQITTADTRYAGEGWVSGTYLRLGWFAWHYLYMAVDASYNPLHELAQETISSDGEYTMRYLNSYDVGAMLGLRWRKNSVIYAHASYTSLHIKQSPDLTSNQFLTRAAFTTTRSGAQIGFGIDTYFWEYLVATFEYDHSFYKKAYGSFVDGNNTTENFAYTYSNNTVTAGLGVSFL